MKLKKFKINQKFIELYLLKLRAYEQYDKKLKNTTKNNVNQTLIHFRKVLKILFKFHTKNKKILFLGLNGLMLRKINKNTIHSAIPSRVKLQNTLFSKTKFKNNVKYSLLKLKKNPKLVVILDKIDHYVPFINEIHTAKIPTVTFGKSFVLRGNTLLYNVPATSEFLLHNKNLFYNCLKFLFKKPKLTFKKPEFSLENRKPTFFKKTRVKKNYAKYG